MNDSSTPAAVVDRQVDAYNTHDLDAFAACYADDVIVANGAGEVQLAGTDALRRQYGEWFAGLPGLHVDVVGRLERGSYVVDDEHVTAEGLEMRAMVVYHVRDGLINRVVLLSED